jgi:PA-IL-like protein
MKNCLRTFFSFALVLALLVPAIADTIRLKDGNVIRGQVIGFNDQQFTVLVGSGAQGRRSRTLIYVEDVESIEFDSATTAAASELANDANTTTPPVSQQPRPSPTPDNNRIPARTNTTQPSPASAPTFFTIKIGVNAKQCTVPAVRAEVCAPNGWTNTGLVVRQGQRLRISATGRVSLGGGRFSTPSGMAGSPDTDKLMRNDATGALIAVIGDDNDDFLLIGTRRDFVAQRDGVLFLGVNEGNLNDNTGTYDVVIEAEARGSGPR